MSAQLLFQNISEYLFVSPEWVKQWAYMPVKAKCHTYNPLMPPELIGKILRYCELGDMLYCYKINDIWNKEVNFTLRQRQEKLIAKREDLKEKCKEAEKEWKKAMDEQELMMK